MVHYPMNARNIVTIGYDEITRVLEIEFKLQAIHQYFDVSIDDFVSLMKAQDIENHYLTFIYCQFYFNVF